MKNYISRPLYIKRIEPFIDKSIIKVITGQRRIGKSYILLQISDIIKKNIPEANIIFVDKEQLSFTEIRNYMDLYQYVLRKVTGHNHNYLFVDEIQEIEEFQLCLRSLLNENKCDIWAGKPSEIDGLLYEPLRLGEQYGVEMPNYEMIVKVLKEKYGE